MFLGGTDGDVVAAAACKVDTVKSVNKRRNGAVVTAGRCVENYLNGVGKHCQETSMFLFNDAANLLCQPACPMTPSAKEKNIRKEVKD